MAGKLTVKAVVWEAATTLTIASGAVTLTQAVHVVAAESGTTDDLDTISPISGVTTPMLALLQADAGDTITVRSGVGNINLNSVGSFVLSGDRTLLLYYDGTNWSDVSLPVQFRYSTANVTVPPTDAELDSALGTPSATNRYQPWLLNDNGAGSNAFLVVNDGTNWWYEELTKAT